ncbi:MAG TPA: hypothetical protein VNQ76_05050 [Planctomicrobium sp.]|nr:hypothetical protein [Planctomicrobium sp.]
MAKRRHRDDLAEGDQAAILFSAFCLIQILGSSSVTLLAGTNALLHDSHCCRSIVLPVLAIPASGISVLVLWHDIRYGGSKSLFIAGMIGSVCLIAGLWGEPPGHSPVIRFLSDEISFSHVSGTNGVLFALASLGSVLLMIVHIRRLRASIRLTRQRPTGRVRTASFNKRKSHSRKLAVKSHG